MHALYNREKELTLTCSNPGDVVYFYYFAFAFLSHDVGGLGEQDTVRRRHGANEQ